MRTGVFLIVALVLSACSTYRKQSHGYRDGVGTYKASSDYGPKAGLIDGPREFNRSLPFTPGGPFQLSWPVRNIKVNRGFRPSTDPSHEGVDLGGKRGYPILAAHEGVVIYTGADFRGYGNMVLVEFNEEWATLYAHLDTVTVSPGQIVASGDSLGGMGSSGQATGVHLHFELLHGRKPIDPLPYLSRSNRFARK